MYIHDALAAHEIWKLFLIKRHFFLFLMDNL